MTVYGPIPVKLIRDKNTISPSPKFDDSLPESTKLRHHLGIEIAYLIDRCGPVTLPEIRIAVSEYNSKEKFAVLINGSGAYRTYDDAWRFITNIFVGMAAVYNLPEPAMKGNLPVYMQMNYEAVMGRANVIKHMNTTEINLRIDNKFDQFIFSGLTALSFMIMPTNPAESIQKE